AATVPLGHVLDDRQAEARAPGFARTAAIDAVEAFGQARQVLGGDARPRVAHAELGRAVGRDAPGRLDAAAARRVTHGVAHEVGHGADELGLGARDPEALAGHR